MPGFFALALLSLCALIPASNLRINEAATRVILDNNQSAVILAVENSSHAAISADVRLEWLSENGETDAAVNQMHSMPPGNCEAVIPLPLPQLAKNRQIWERLRYSVRAEGSETSGILSLVHLAAHVFELRTTLPKEVRPGETLKMLVTTLHPVTLKPVAGTVLQASLDLDEREPIKAEAQSDAQGLAHLEFKLPEQIGADDLEVTIDARRGDFHQTAGVWVELNLRYQIGIQTDKPLYQPGQTLHVRLLGFDAAHRAAANLPLKLRIVDPERTGVFVAHLVSNRYGVAAVDWDIPANVRLGDYGILVESEGEDSAQRFGAMHQVKISRYELPDFRVSVKPDRSYYVLGQNSVAEVSAEYLFGKPVANAHVRVVRENSREWNYKLQKWEIEEGDKYEGQTDASGRFSTRIDLKEMHADLAEHEHRYFEDVSFTAYVRDPFGGRTEQRRFDLRVTRESIHVYLIQMPGNQFAVSTSYADGSPASARLLVKGAPAGTTNRYGVARLKIPQDMDEIEISADDGRGASGHLKTDVHRRNRSLLVQTDRSLYRPGEPIHVEITSSEPTRFAVLQVLSEGHPVDSRPLDLSDRSATLVLPWRQEFTREVTIGVVAEDGDEAGSRTVLYPSNRDLSLSVRLDRVTYRPGDEALAVFEARSSEGKPVEGALGIAVVDEAVGERVRTDAETGGGVSFQWHWPHIGMEGFMGISRRDLYRLDCSKPFQEDLDLVAEILLSADRYSPGIDRSVDYESELPGAFQFLLTAQFAPVEKTLNTRYNSDYHYPRDVEAFKQDLRNAGIDFDSMRDPWNSPYRVQFDLTGTQEGFEIKSAGPDRKFGTSDDLMAQRISWSYFRQTHDSIARVLNALPEFPRSEQGVRTALANEKIYLDALRDPWGNPYRFRYRLENNRAFLTVWSPGPDRLFDPRDDIRVDEISGNYFRVTYLKLSEILNASQSFPKTDQEWNRLLRVGGIPRILDLWDHYAYVTFGETSRYADLLVPKPVLSSGNRQQVRIEIVPVTRWFHVIHLRSAGPDGIEGTSDDFDLCSFSRDFKSEANRSWQPTPRYKGRPRSGTYGAIFGIVTDSSGGVLPNASVRVVSARASSAVREYEVQTAQDGTYLLDTLPPGVYDLRINLSGFHVFIKMGLSVIRGRTLVVDATLEIGTVTETITVEAEPPLSMTTMSSLLSMSPGISSSGMPLSTPRLREYFPETLVWHPFLETGPDGKAELKFKLADNITTWKLDVVGSTRHGELGTGSAEIRAFQPFFVDHNPPKVLTQGDELQLPVTVRNYLDQAQKVSIAMKPESWFQLSGPGEQDLSVPQGTSVNAVFPLKAVASITNGKQRLTAASAAAGDAIEKSVSVHPDGNEIVEIQNQIFNRKANFDLLIPQDAIGNSGRTELKITPNLLANVVESIEGILKRPTGCAEQTISSAYPNLLFLSFLKRAGISSQLEPVARRNLQYGVDRLLGYQAAEGGFGYWGSSAPDVSLTAYAVSFLTEAKEFAAFDRQIQEKALTWLINQQGKDGSWPSRDWNKQPDSRRTLYQTALVALSLPRASASAGLNKALEFLSRNTLQFDEPYAIAAMAVAARRNNNPEIAGNALQRLRLLVRSEGGLAYWNLESNSPFYGWGLAGRLETSALAVLALSEGANPADKSLVDRGILFLLKNKDRFGVWHSTQATVRVLEAIMTVARQSKGSVAGTQAEILVDGQIVDRVSLPPGNELSQPIRVDLSRSMTPGRHLLSIRSAGDSSQGLVQLISGYYVPWTNRPVASHPSLKMSVHYDKLIVKIGEAITCRVAVERVGFRGYGMLLAEIGLPPGADVDRQSLDQAVQSSGALGHYDILPDRVVAYLWPRAGGTQFTFRFRPRFALRAKTAPSLLYDYYNPDALTLVAPVAVRVDEASGDAAVKWH